MSSSFGESRTRFVSGIDVHRRWSCSFWSPRRWWWCMQQWRCHRQNEPSTSSSPRRNLQWSESWRFEPRRDFSLSLPYLEKKQDKERQRSIEYYLLSQVMSPNRTCARWLGVFCFVFCIRVRINTKGNCKEKGETKTETDEYWRYFPREQVQTEIYLQHAAECFLSFFLNFDDPFKRIACPDEAPPLDRSRGDETWALRRASKRWCNASRVTA